MTVEQRVYSRDDEDSQRVEKPLVVEDEVLSENGAQVKNSLFAIIERYQDSNPALAELILAEVKSYPDQLFNTWLKLCDPSTFPAELDQAMARIDKNEPEGGGVSQWDFIFKNGAFIGLPIEVYLYILKQVALTKLNGQPHQVNDLFSLQESERAFLSEHGFNPTTTPIRKFFTSSHIQFGQQFLTREGFLSEERRRLVVLALAHHFSQAELPNGLKPDDLLNDEHQLKTCAYLEILDKVDAVFHRGTLVTSGENDEETKQKAIDSAVNIAHTEIQTNLSRNYPNHERLREVYTLVIVAMKDAGVFNFA